MTALMTDDQLKVAIDQELAKGVGKKCPISVDDLEDIIQDKYGTENCEKFIMEFLRVRLKQFIGLDC